jgi:hypothetical protein
MTVSADSVGMTLAHFYGMDIAQKIPTPAGLVQMDQINWLGTDSDPAERLRVFRGERLDQKDAELSCRDVFQAASHAIECIGPALIEEASSSHQGAWKV